MGANQSDQQGGDDILKRITVVNPNPEQEATRRKTLPPRVPPILSLDGHTIDPNRHKAESQIDHKLWIDFASAIEKFSNSRADLVATRQSQLHEKIIQVDHHVQVFTDSYINDKHKALARMNEDCRRVEEINKVLQKCTIQSELCVDMLNKLNFLLPDEHKLEPIEIQ